MSIDSNKNDDQTNNDVLIEIIKTPDIIETKIPSAMARNLNERSTDRFLQDC